MIVVKQKRLADMTRMLAGHGRVLIVGCNTCAAVALAGGEKEVETIEELLRLQDSRKGMTRAYGTAVLTRQCEPEYIEELDAGGYDAVLSMGCGAGVALLSEQLGIPVYPALDTLFIGASQGVASWRAECSACGQCVLGETAGICPVTRCAKGILNGPCGGVNEGKCEADPDRDCAWVLIYERLAARERLDDFARTLPPKDHSTRITLHAWEVEEGGEER
ncbi:MAG: methylenetetrahydrofolate reductase C-terminal domain-containing protein [Coriobacteriia bacterium]